jgi:DNA-directed RNA polymerase specialized sigma24 family protein
VDRDEALFRLPTTYQRVMTWLAEGLGPEEIAARLGTEPSAVPALIELATAKFVRAADDARRPKEK